MNRRNPTPLLVGMSGMLDSRRYTVLGRVVLTVEQDGETYHWNEFNLVDASGRATTLVYEETDEGSPWKQFTLFEPHHPLSAREAAEKRVGSMADVDGRHARVSMVSQSRVVHIEGQAPEGVEVGDIARYFNAEAGDTMVVVSWSEEEVEHYEGRPISARTIELAFGLPRGTARQPARVDHSGPRSDSSMAAVIGAAVVSVLAFGFAGYSCVRDSRPPEPPPKLAAAPTSLGVGRRGVLAGRMFTITAHALVEVSRVGKRFDRHEYSLGGAFGDSALLINGLIGAPQEWHILTPIEPPANFSPYDAAALRPGRETIIAGRSTRVVQLFLAKVLSREGVASADVWPSPINYGLLARANDDWLVARWTESNLQLYEGRAVSAAEIDAAVGPPKPPADKSR